MSLDDLEAGRKFASDEDAGWAGLGDVLRRPLPCSDAPLWWVDGPGRVTRGSSKYGLETGGPLEESRGGGPVVGRCTECDLARGRPDECDASLSCRCRERERSLCLRRYASAIRSLSSSSCPGPRLSRSISSSNPSSKICRRISSSIVSASDKLRRDLRLDWCSIRLDCSAASAVCRAARS